MNGGRATEMGPPMYTVPSEAPEEFRPPMWSFSSAGQFETCPKQYAEVRVYKRIKEVMGVEASWGDAVHKSLEMRVKTGAPLPPAHEPYAVLADAIRQLPGTVVAEQDIALDMHLQLVQWMDPKAWLRGKIDILQINGNRALVLDWKTGKVKPKSDQLRLFALMVFATRPEVDMVRTAFIWIKHRQRTVAEFTRAQVDAMWEPFREKYHRIMWAHITGDFPARPSGLCNGWCPVTDCVHWKPKRS